MDWFFLQLDAKKDFEYDDKFHWRLIPMLILLEAWAPSQARVELCIYVDKRAWIFELEIKNNLLPDCGLPQIIYVDIRPKN